MPSGDISDIDGYPLHQAASQPLASSIAQYAEHECDMGPGERCVTLSVDVRAMIAADILVFEAAAVEWHREVDEAVEPE